MPYTGTQIRPQGSDGPFYNPDRDLAYIFSAAFSQAVMALDDRYINPELKEFLVKLGVSESDVQKAVDAASSAVEIFVLKRKTNDPKEALKEAGWYDLPYASRYVIMSRLGEVMLAAFLYSMIQVHTVHGTTPDACQVDNLLAACRRFVGLPADEEEQVDLESLRAQIDVLRADLEHLRYAYDRSQDEFAAVCKQVEEACKRPRMWWFRLAISSPDERRKLLGIAG